MLNCTFFRLLLMGTPGFRRPQVNYNSIKFFHKIIFCLFLQEWMYNVIPWLVAIPSALGGGYASDFLINQGIKQVSSFFYCGMCFEVSYCTFHNIFFTFCVFLCRICCSICEKDNAGKCDCITSQCITVVFLSDKKCVCVWLKVWSD